MKSEVIIDWPTELEYHRRLGNVTSQETLDILEILRNIERRLRDIIKKIDDSGIATQRCQNTD